MVRGEMTVMNANFGLDPAQDAKSDNWLMTDQTAHPKKEKCDLGPDSERDGLVVERITNLPDVASEQSRLDEAKRLNSRPSRLDKPARPPRRQKTSGETDFEEAEPWGYPVEVSELLQEVSDTVSRFIVCPKETADTVALWVAMTWIMEAVNVAPLAVITAPEKRCGKTQLLTIMGKLVYRPLMASNISPAALFRSIDAWSPTLLIDEADTFLPRNEELRGILNSGHTRDAAYIVRTVGENFTPKKFSTWGAKAISGIGKLQETLMDRSVTLTLRRKLPDERVEKLRHAESDLFPTLASKLARFALDNEKGVRDARPHLPDWLNDREQDNWEPLLAIAEVAGGRWPEDARAAAREASIQTDTSTTYGTELLFDIREIFLSQDGNDKIFTADLIEKLCADPEKRWASYSHNEAITPRQLSTMLKEYKITSKTIRIVHSRKGYERRQFDDAFARYLPSKSVTT